MPVLKKIVLILFKLARIINNRVGRMPILKNLKETILLFRAKYISIILKKIVAEVEIIGRLVLNNKQQKSSVVITKKIQKVELAVSQADN